MHNKTHRVSNVLLDFIFGGPMAQPEVMAQDTETAWQAWMAAMTARNAAGDGGRDDHGFEHTRPLSWMH